MLQNENGEIFARDVIAIGMIANTQAQKIVSQNDSITNILEEDANNDNIFKFIAFIFTLIMIIVMNKWFIAYMNAEINKKYRKTEKEE